MNFDHMPELPLGARLSGRALAHGGRSASASGVTSSGSAGYKRGARGGRLHLLQDRRGRDSRRGRGPGRPHGRRSWTSTRGRAAHALVIPRNHSRNLLEIDEEDLAHVPSAAKRLAVRMRERLGCDGINLFNSSETAAWQTVFHFHMHVIPRYEDDPLRLPGAPQQVDQDELQRAGGGAAMRVAAARLADRCSPARGGRRAGRPPRPSTTATTRARGATSRRCAPCTTAATTGSRTSSASTPAIAPGNFRNAVDEHGPPGSVCINIWTRRTPWEASPNFDVCVTADRERKLRRERQPARSRGGVRRAGSASAELTSQRRLVVRFDPDLIRRPAAYRWSRRGDDLRARLHEPRLQGLCAAPWPHGADGTGRARVLSKWRSAAFP